MTSPMNWAVIGCGALARGAHIPNIAKSKRMNLHTCCDLSDDALAECRRKYEGVQTSHDFEAVIKNPDVHAVCIATTEKLRLPVIAAAAEAGKPVYVEKPVARTLHEMYEIQRVVHEARIPFCVGHNRRSSPAMIDAHSIFRRHMISPAPCPWRWDREGANRPKLRHDGVAGISVRINEDWWSWKKWVFDKEQAPEGPMLFEMTHFTDICNWFLAAQPVKVVSIAQEMLGHGVVIGYAGGEIATIFSNSNGTFGYPKELYEAFGNGGAVVVDHMVEVRTAGIENVSHRLTYAMINDRHPDVGIEGGIAGWLAKKRAACAEAAANSDPMLAFAAEPDKGHARALERFADQIEGIGPEVCGIDDAVLATRVAFAAIRSARNDRAVLVEEV